MAKTRTINVENTEIAVILQHGTDDYICLTDMARFRDSDRTNYVIQNWIRARTTIEFLGVWEILHNPNFKSTEFDAFRNNAGLNTFTLTPKEWSEKTNAIGIYSKAGRYGGTYAHKDIAFNFGMWLSPAFQLYVVKEYQRLVEAETNPLSLQWDVKRLLAKTNYTLHTDAIKSVIIPQLNISEFKTRYVYANEADMLNIALFGCTAKDWRESNPGLAKQGKNLRDCASINQLIVISNMESYNSIMIQNGVDKQTRKRILYKTAKKQLETLNKNNAEQQLRKIGERERDLFLPD